MAYKRPIVMSIAGLDPSGGAGLLADVKTFEQYHCLGFGVATAYTVQTEDRFESVYWLPLAHILEQLQALLAQYKVAAVKVGIVENMEVLESILDTLPAGIPVVWDPVLYASGGGQALTNISRKQLPKVHIITPNVPECVALTGIADAQQAAITLSQHNKVYLKGGHAAEKGVDFLYDDGQLLQRFETSGELPPKHGSGCILSSAIAAGLATGLDDIAACAQAKAYTEQRLNSNAQLLAYHHV